MYQIRCDDKIIYDPRDDALTLTAPRCKVEVNTTGEASFTMYADHPYYSSLQKLRSVIEILQDGETIFRGRVTEDTLDFDNVKNVDVEGVLAFFNDTLVRPFAFPGDFQSDENYLTAETSGNVVRYFLGWLIDRHNAQVDEFQRFILGNVTVSDPNNYITRESTEHLSTWEVLKTRLFESGLGGYLCIRYEKDGNYIDYLSDFELTNTQRIAFGENLLDLQNESDGNETYTAVLPLGAQIENEETKTKTRLTIAGLPDGNITEDIVKSGDILYSKSARQKYGFKCAPAKVTTWDDVTEAENLQANAAQYLAATAVKFLNTITIKAVDLNFTNPEIEAFRIYRYIKIESKPHNQSGRYMLTQIDLDIENPQNTVFTLGDKTLTLTDKNSSDKQNAGQQVESAVQQASQATTSIAEINSTILEMSTSILQSSEDIILSALQNYVETSNYEQYKETIAAQLQLLADQMTLNFTSVTEQIENVNGDLQAKYNEITKYFTFDINGLTIGQVDSPYKMVLDNDRFSMHVNDMEVLWIADGEVHTPELTVTRKFNLFGLNISKDDDGNISGQYTGVSE